MKMSDFSGIDFRTSRWHWHSLAPEIIDFLKKSAPSDRRWVKVGSARAVARTGDFFLKFNRENFWQSRFFPDLRQEFLAARALREAGIATVEHLGWGRRGGVTLLVTRAWHEDARNVADFWYENFVSGGADPTDFLTAFGVYLAELLRKPLRHPDFHLGNILWSPCRQEFALVDLHHVGLGAKKNLPDQLALLEVLPKLREAVTPEVLLNLLCFMTDWDEAGAGRVLRHLLLRERQYVLDQWPRRVGQLLSGYPKFSRFLRWKEQVLLVRHDALRRPLFDPDSAERGAYRKIKMDFPAALERMLFSFYLTLLKIPHLAAAALAQDGTLYWQQPPADAKKAGRARVNGFNEYLLCFELNSADYGQWIELPGGRLLVADIDPMLNSIPDRAFLRPAGVHPAEWRAAEETASC